MYTIYDELELEQLLDEQLQLLLDEQEHEQEELDEEQEYFTIKMFGLIPLRFENALNMLSIESYSSAAERRPVPSSASCFTS